MKKKILFVIPEYQRPYAWTEEEVETLFEDLWEFAVTTGGPERESSYFLGSIVSYENNNKQEIIDGQQRITSLFLLLRAIYTKLYKGEKKPESENFIRKIEPAIWQTNKLTGAVDYSNVLLKSNVINNDGNEIFRKILETGKADENAKDNYSKNYRHLQKLLHKPWNKDQGHHKGSENTDHEGNGDIMKKITYKTCNHGDRNKDYYCS